MKSLPLNLERGRRWAVAFLMVALLSCMLAPACFAEAPVHRTQAPPTAASAGVPGAQGLSGPFYQPDEMRRVAQGSSEQMEDIAAALPDEMLPASLRKVAKGAKGANPLDQDAGGPAGGGTGGWTGLVRPYDPSVDPNISYDTQPENNIIDSNGTLHFIYGVSHRTDVSQWPDPAGTAFKDLAEIWYVTYSGGQWSTPVNLTPVTGFTDTFPVLWDIDKDGVLHLGCIRYSWWRSPTTGTYIEADSNLLYRHRATDGAWAPLMQVTNFTGAYSAPNGNARLLGDRIMVIWYEILDKDTAPASFTGNICVVEGAKDSWGPVVTLRQWDYTNAAGQVQPAGFPVYDRSPLNGEITATYGLVTIGPTANDNFSDVYGLVRDPAGNWGAATKLTNAAAATTWFGEDAHYYAGDNSCMAGMVEVKGHNSVAVPIPSVNTYVTKHGAGGWSALDCATDAPPGEVAMATTMQTDPFGGLHMLFLRVRMHWDAGLTSWVADGSQMLYADNTSGTFDEPQVVQAFADKHFYVFSLRNSALDSDGFMHAAFIRYKLDGGVISEFQLFYSSNGPAAGGARGGAFQAPVQLSTDSPNRLEELDLTVSQGGDPLVTWMESRVTAGIPEVGAIRSRRLSAVTWSATRTVSAVTGSSDIIHVVPGGYPRYYSVLGLLQGEQALVFETAKFDPGTGTYSDFKKYFASTADGLWSGPVLISSAAVSGVPQTFVDTNMRIFALFEANDPATGKGVIYGSMQPDASPAACTYYFAEGTTRQQQGEMFDEWISLQNPGSTDANVGITYMLGTGETKLQEFVVPKTSRVTVKVNDAVGPDQDVSAKVESDTPVVAERPMYFDYRGWQGGHDAMGAISTSRVWYFAEGNTLGDFSQYLTIQNPADVATNVKVTYMLGNGSTVDQMFTVGPHTRATIDPRSVVEAGNDVSMKVLSENAAIVCERPMYFDYQSFAPGGHNVMGGLFPTNRWYFAEGTTRAGFDTFVCLQNPFAFEGTATLTYLLGDGTTRTQQVVMAPTSRRTVKVNDAVGLDQDVAVVVDSTIPLLAERPMYFNYNGFAPGGHVSMGALFPTNAWFLAEGTTRSGFEEWLSLENPGDQDASATVTFMLGDGSTVVRTATVPAKTRVTIKVNDLVPAGQDVSTSVWADRGIIVERPMYFSYLGGWAGGTDVLGFPSAYPPPAVIILFIAMA